MQLAILSILSILLLIPLGAKEPQASTARYAQNAKCYHWAHDIVNFGDLIELEDGSKWSVAKTDVYKASSWQLYDQIVITPAAAWFWFSSPKYRLTNQITGTCVEADLYLGPRPFGPYTHWVVALDKYAGHVFLEDGSSWTVAHEDWTLFDKWLINDFIIIGRNDSWFSSYEYILINVNAEHHITVNPFKGL
jgi:hypothetical protein